MMDALIDKRAAKLNLIQCVHLCISCDKVGLVYALSYLVLTLLLVDGARIRLTALVCMPRCSTSMHTMLQKAWLMWRGTH